MDQSIPERPSPTFPLHSVPLHQSKQKLFDPSEQMQVTLPLLFIVPHPYMHHFASCPSS